MLHAEILHLLFKFDGTHKVNEEQECQLGDPQEISPRDAKQDI